MKFIIGKKLNMTQVFREDGTVVPVTRVQVGPCVVTHVKVDAGNGISSVQLGFGEQKVFRLNKAQKGHLKDIHVADNKNTTVRHLHEFHNDNDLKRGDVFDATIFEAGEKVFVTGRSKGKGFQGVVKRHGFKGSPASHGHKDQLRMPGSIGATGPQRVFKGTRMGGHMGDATVTVKNLEIVEVHPEQNELYIKGAVPGARNSLVYITTTQGTIEAKKSEELIEEAKPEAAEMGEEEVKDDISENVSEEKREEQPADVAQEEKKEESSTEEKTK